MRPFATTLGAALAAAALTLSLPGSAYAAQGTLDIGWHRYENPVGCYNVPDGSDSAVVNRTDRLVLVFDAPNCQGNVLGGVNPGSRSSAPGGTSVYVD